MSRRSAQVLLELLKTQSVVEFRDILRALDGASSSTAFRYLQQVPYRSSYNYSLSEIKFPIVMTANQTKTKTWKTDFGNYFSECATRRLTTSG